VRIVLGSGSIQVAAYTSDMLIRDVLLSNEAAPAVFERHGLACCHCLAAEMETLAAVASMHEIPVDVLLADLNALSTQKGDDTDA
jgi:hybrid cluster-associated redox disulfide protein